MNWHLNTSAWVTKQKSRLRDFIKAREGTTAIEYGLIGALVSVVIVIALALVSGKLTVLFTAISNAFL